VGCISGVSSAAQGRGAGYALKLHQRAWAITHGIERVTWTFDPLVRRNARFNLTKLGATAVAYHDNFYGAMHDGVNRDDESDRCSASWEVSGPKAAAAAAAGAVTAEDPEHGDAAIVLQADGAGAPVVTASSADRRVCWIPPDIVAMRAVDPGAARAWRMALRATLGAAMEAGLVATAMTRSGWYVLERP
jgi:predicted GNAT superfamily acetyltransferase